jgi:2-oxoglutarate ferredoxin oxidoreductase subunit alpha
MEKEFQIMQKNRIHILAGGPAGTGIESVSHSLALAFTREGLYAITSSEYQNIIRGGHSFASVHVSNKEVLSHQLHYDVLIAMDKNSITEHIAEIDEGGAVIYDGEKIKTEDIEIPKGVEMISVPLNRLAKEAGLSLAANVVAVGATFALLDRDFEKMKTVLQTIFDRKGEEVVRINHAALAAGYDFVQKNTSHRIPTQHIAGDQKKRFLMSGNDAICLGAIRAGIKFLAAYPMTPGSTIMTTLAKESRHYDIVVLHAEDEIAAVNMAIGAGHSGIRAATSTSGGGFALMSEATSLAGQIEAPVVIFNAQRPGPSTGLPTRTGQGDLRMAMHCGQGDFPRLVLAAGDHEDCVQLTAQAFNLAEKYQIPVIFLTEKYIADQYRTCEYNIDEGIEIDRGKLAKDEALGDDFQRYKDMPDGVSPRSVPGMQGGRYTSTSYEHDERGKPVEEVPEVSVMMEKRWKKMHSLEQELPPPKVFGKSENKVMVWGGTKNPALEAQQILTEKGIEIEIIQMQYIHPFKTEAAKETLNNRKNLIMIEGNQSGQLESVLAEHTGIRPDYSIRNYYGRPMTGEWIAEEIVKKLKN